MNSNMKLARTEKAVGNNCVLHNMLTLTEFSCNAHYFQICCSFQNATMMLLSQHVILLLIITSEVS